MKTNEQLQRDVQDAIKSEPLLNLWEINITAMDNIIHLSGTVDNYTNKLKIQNAVKNVEGVKTVYESIKIEGMGEITYPLITSGIVE